MQKYIERLNAPEAEDRLKALSVLAEMIRSGEMSGTEKLNFVNNHIHTIYSFSPYSPSKAVWMAYTSGLQTAGIMDHDSIAGAREFIRSGEVMGLAITIGAEIRVTMKNTPLAGKRTNNPDQDGVSYMAIHGVPHTQIDRLQGFLRSLSVKRNVRNKKMTDKLNGLMGPYGISVDYAADVVPISMFAEGGSITERHISMALARKILGKYPAGTELVRFMTETMKITMTDKIKGYLSDNTNKFADYDLVGVIKSELIPKFFIPADEECPDLSEVIALVNEIGAILAYAYLGDVGVSVTGDKKTQKFEDDYLVEVFDTLKAFGVKAVTYMPSRNTIKQLTRLRALCDEYGFLQISGEDINQPRQTFTCSALANPMFGNLFETTYALIGHERLATENADNGFFSEKTVREYPELYERIKRFAAAGRAAGR